jgi:hypothetical protein
MNTNGRHGRADEPRLVEAEMQHVGKHDEQAPWVPKCALLIRRCTLRAGGPGPLGCPGCPSRHPRDR